MKDRIGKILKDGRLFLEVAYTGSIYSQASIDSLTSDKEALVDALWKLNTLSKLGVSVTCQEIQDIITPTLKQVGK